MEGGTGVGGIGGESNNQGAWPEVSDSSDLIEFKTTYESGSQTAEWWQQNLNLDSYYSYRSIVEGIHHYDIGFGKNYFFYHNPETGQWETVPWDLDLTWANNMFGNGNEPFRSRVLPIPEFGLAYRNRMREIRDLLYNTEQVGLLVEESASHVYSAGEPSLVDADRAMWDYNPILVSGFVNQSKAGHGRYYAGGGGIPASGSYAGMMQLLVDYAESRGNWIDSNVLTDTSSVPIRPEISYSGTTGFPLNQLEFTTTDYASPISSPFSALEWRVAEVHNSSVANYDPSQPYIYEIEGTWESGELTTFDSQMAIPGSVLAEGHTYRARVRMQDTTGRWSHWSEAVEFVASAPVDVPSLSITELHYHPFDPNVLDPSTLEFIEILNTGSETIDLSGMQLADFAATPYVFPAATSLGGGEYMVVARDSAAFTAYYGPGINLAVGDFSGSLSNGGETVGLYTSSGVLIQSVAYDDDVPWPTTPDGTGPSLEVIDPLGDPSDGGNWRASFAVGGSPGANGNLPGDYDRSGTVDQLDYGVWRSQFGASVSAGSGADGNGDGRVDVADYTVWRDNLGASVASLAVDTNDEEAGDQAPAALLASSFDSSSSLAFPGDGNSPAARPPPPSAIGAPLDFVCHRC